MSQNEYFVQSVTLVSVYVVQDCKTSENICHIDYQQEINNLYDYTVHGL